MGAVDDVDWAHVLCGHRIQNDWASRALNLHHILHQARTFLLRNYSDDSGGRSYGILVIGSFITTTLLLMHHVSCRVIWWKNKSPKWLSPLQPTFGALWLLAFPKTKIIFEREETTDWWWDSGKYGDWGTVWGPKVPTLKGTEASLSYVPCFLYLVSCSVSVSIFHMMWLNTFWTDLIWMERGMDR